MSGRRSLARLLLLARVVLAGEFLLAVAVAAAGVALVSLVAALVFALALAVALQAFAAVLVLVATLARALVAGGRDGLGRGGERLPAEDGRAERRRLLHRVPTCR